MLPPTLFRTAVLRRLFTGSAFLLLAPLLAAQIATPQTPAAKTAAGKKTTRT